MNEYNVEEHLKWCQNTDPDSNYRINKNGCVSKKDKRLCQWIQNNIYCKTKKESKIDKNNKGYCIKHCNDKSLTRTCDHSNCIKNVQSKANEFGKRYCIKHCNDRSLLKLCNNLNCNNVAVSNIDEFGNRYCVKHCLNLDLIRKCDFLECNKFIQANSDKFGKRYCRSHTIDKSLIYFRKCKFEDCKTQAKSKIDINGDTFCTKHCSDKSLLRLCNFEKCDNLAKSILDNLENTYCYSHANQTLLHHLCQIKDCDNHYVIVFNNNRVCRNHCPEKLYKCDKCDNSYYSVAELNKHVKKIKKYGNCELIKKISEGEITILNILLNNNIIKYPEYINNLKNCFIHDQFCNEVKSKITNRPLRFDFIIFDAISNKFFIEYSPPETHISNEYKKFIERRCKNLSEEDINEKVNRMLSNYNTKIEYANKNGKFIEFTKLSELTNENIINELKKNGFHF